MSVEEVAGKVPANYLRVFYQQEDLLELHELEPRTPTHVLGDRKVDVGEHIHIQMD